MTMAAIAILLQYGIPFVEFLVNTLKAQGVPTPPEWDTLKLLANVSARDELIARLAAAGIPLTDARAVALLALVP